MEELPYVTTCFSYTDEYGETTELKKTHSTSSLEDGDTYFLTEEFKRFLLACGYHDKWVNKIVYLEDNHEPTDEEMLAYTE